MKSEPVYTPVAAGGEPSYQSKDGTRSLSCVFQGGLGAQLYQIAEVYRQADELSYLPIFDYRTSRVIGQGEHPYCYKENIYKNLEWSYEEPTLLLRGFYNTPPDKALIKKLKKILYLPKKNKNNKIGFHIRRGDLLRNPTPYPVVSIDFYKDELKNIDPEDVLIFSDSLEIIKQELGPEYYYWENTSVIQTFYEMMNCKKLVGANSAFSNWAAILGNVKIQNPVITGNDLL